MGGIPRAASASRSSRRRWLVCHLWAVSSAASTSQDKEVLVPLPAGGHVALSTRGSSAFRARFLPAGQEDLGPLRSPMVAPGEADAPFSKVKWDSLGDSSACLMDSNDNSTDGRGTAQAKTADSLDMCKSLCEQANDCTGIEWGVESRRCEFWTLPIGAIRPATGVSCYNFTRKAADVRTISVVGLGSLSVSEFGKLELRGKSGELLTNSEPIGDAVEPAQAPARAGHPGGWFQGTPGEIGDQQVWSGDTIYLRAKSGKYLEAEDVEVRARFDQPGAWQGFVIESRFGDGPIRHRDTVFLHTHLGSAVDAHDGRVRARWDAHGLWQELEVERKYGWGTVKVGDRVRFKSTEGKYIGIQDERVDARSSTAEASQDFTVLKAKSTRSLRSGDGIWLRDCNNRTLQVEVNAVTTANETHAANQRWLVRKNGAEAGTPILSGDTVSLVSFTGIPMEVQEDVVMAKSNRAGEWQDLVIESAKGPGSIEDGDVIFLRAYTGNYINVATDIAVPVQARWTDRGAGQSFTVITRPTTCTQTVALNGTAAASSWTFAGQPYKAVDGDVSTSWTSRAEAIPATAPSSDGEWLSIDLGGVHELSRVEIRWDEEYARSYFVQGMLEGHQWTTFALAVGRAGWTVTVLPRGSRARWVRIRTSEDSASANSTSYAISEFIVYACQELLALSSRGGPLYGRGASPYDALKLTAVAVQAQVSNRATFVPYYYSADGYGAMGLVGHRTNMYFGRVYPVSYMLDDNRLLWGHAGAFELFLMPAATLEAGTQAFLALTGVPRVPPRYAFGFLASQWNWKDRQTIESTIEGFRSGGFPLDVLAVDLEAASSVADYGLSAGGSEDYQDFGFRNRTFPTPARQLARYRQKHEVRICGMRTPRLGNATSLAMATSKGWILPQGAPGGDYPPDLERNYGFGRQLNFSNEDARAWYSAQLLPLINAGVECWWNDEGEADYFTYHWWNVAESDALLRSNAMDPRKRFFSMNRAFTPGLARLGAIAWTGDVEASWEDLRRTPGMMLNWGLAGAPYVGCDIGGFMGDSEPELLTRWMQVGIFLPIMRIHSSFRASPHWPWKFGEETAVAIKAALELRYRLIPYHYSLAHAIFARTALWMRPLAMDFPAEVDATAAGLTTQWMDGRLLVAPVLWEDSHKQVYLPNGMWYEFNSSRTIEGPVHLGGRALLSEIPVFVPPGTLLPLAPVVQSTDALPGGLLEMQIYRGADGSFELVEDDGETVAYEVGRVRTTSFRWYDAAGTLSWRARGALVEPGGRAFTQLRVTVFDSEGQGHLRTQHLGPYDLADGGSTTSLQQLRK